MAYIHYKFRSARDYDSLVVDGMGMSVLDLKLEIVRQKKLKGEDFELVLSNAESGDEYKDDMAIIARNSSVVVRRTPVPDAKRRNILAGTAKYNAEELQKARVGAYLAMESARSVAELVPVMPTERTQRQGIPGLAEEEEPTKDEEAQLNAMFQANKFHWEATQEKMAGLKRVRYAQFGAQNNPRPGPLRQPPPGYVCYRCGVKGHFIQDCPTNGDSTFDRPKVKRTTGIPKSFLKEVDPGDGSGFPPDASTVMINAEGKFVQFVSNDAAWRKIQSQMTAAMAKNDQMAEIPHVPDDLACGICAKLLREALEIPCCHARFCEECILEALGVKGARCPSCKAETAIESLAPNQDVRMRAFKFLRTFSQQRQPTANIEVLNSFAPETAQTVSIKAMPSTLESRITMRGDRASETGHSVDSRPKRLKAETRSGDRKRPRLE